MEPEGLFPHLHEPTTCWYPEPDQSSPRLLPVSLRFISILASYRRLQVYHVR